MSTQTVEAVWLDEHTLCTLEELVQCSGLTVVEVRELAALGALPAQPGPADVLLFSARSIVTARSARRLRDDFELDLAGLGVALHLLQRIERLEQELNALQARGC